MSRPAGKSDANHGKPRQKQIRAERDMLRALKLHAADKELLLIDVYREAMLEFVERRKKDLVEGQGQLSRSFYASPSLEAVTFNVALTSSQMADARKSAEKDKVSAACVIYTALVMYLQRRKIIR